MDEKKTHPLIKTAHHFLLALWALFALFPLVWMVIITFKKDEDMYDTVFLFTPTLENYRQVLIHSDYFKAFMDNLIVSSGAVLVSVLVGVPAAYALARFKFRGKEDIAFTILSFRFAPEILVILPLFMAYQQLGLLDTYFGLIWVYQLITMPLLVWVLRGYFEEISVEIEQAAQRDGYGPWDIFKDILLPLIKPGLVASALLAFIFAWNNFAFPLFLTGSAVETVTVSSLKYLASDTVHYGQMAVAAAIAALPEILMAIVIQKHLVRGLSFGAVKG